MDLLTRASMSSVPKVRLVMEGQNEVLPTGVALRLAEDRGMDLIVVSDKSDPPVVKIQDYKKLLYEKKKEKSKQRSVAHQSVMKEIQLKLNIADHDLETKLNMVKKFIARGDKVKINVRLKGREKEMPQRVHGLIQRVVDASACKATAAGFGAVILEAAS